MPPISLNVNGRSIDVDADPQTPLLWLLRDELGLTGTKFGCGRGFCGACTVHVDGVATRSCTLTTERAAGRRITTIEGLAATNGGALHPVQQAWLEHDVPQCGYCQAGQIMTAASLLNRTARPSESDVATAMNGHICRCGTYIRIREALQRAAQLRAGSDDTGGDAS